MNVNRPLAKVEKQIRGIIEAINAGMFHESMKLEMDALEAHKKTITAQLAEAPQDAPDLLPTTSAIYARKVAALNQPAERPHAAGALRLLIEKIVLTPGPKRGEIDALPYGDLGTILNWVERQAVVEATNANTPGAARSGVSISVVAGAGFEPAAFRL